MNHCVYFTTKKKYTQILLFTFSFLLSTSYINVHACNIIDKQFVLNEPRGREVAKILIIFRELSRNKRKSASWK
jgi:hypothetical protein